MWYVALSRATENFVLAEEAFACTVPFVAPLVGGNPQMGIVTASAGAIGEVKGSVAVATPDDRLHDR